MLLIEKPSYWLENFACPLWFRKGIDERRGGFFEEIDLNGNPLNIPRRCMVQARQIVCLNTARTLDILPEHEAKRLIESGIRFVLKYYRLPNGSFCHSVDDSFSPLNKTPDLYAQSFMLLGLAHAYEALGTPEYKSHALTLIHYLFSDRKLPQGGFSEIQSNRIVYEANPHMHLLEAALQWAPLDQDPIWLKTIEELVTLCRSKFVDQEKGLLAEHFNENWAPLKTNGIFIFEPGHHYEWAWLLGLAQKYVSQDLLQLRTSLFRTSEQHGVSPSTGFVYGEVVSDLKSHLKDARFWPLTERIKASLQLGLEYSREKERYAFICDNSLKALFRFLDTPTPGLWYDTHKENGLFVSQPAKASSFYHILGAMKEYINHRPRLS